ncbi:MAG: transcription termination factor NusA [Cytophagaceae bacterium]|jgi:N utilization substance protein A|nr:transcription termination factor NusA [Cytophagaceae bacterium]
MSKRETFNLTDIFAEFKEQKNIDQTTLRAVMVEAFRSVITKTFGTAENYTIIINELRNDLELSRYRIVVADGSVKNPSLQIAFSEARKIVDDIETGEEITEPVNFLDFGRRAILNLRQTLASKIMDLQKTNFYSKYTDRIGQIVSGELYQMWKKENLMLDEDGNEMYLPVSEQIPNDYFRKGDNIRAVVHNVENHAGNPKVILSRTSPVFLERLFELEVPEINEGLITIKRIARIPGERAKVAVESYDDRIDPVGACVGVKGGRIYGIVRELKNESIDVINYTNNISLFISRSLSPAKITSIHLNENEKKAEIYLKPEEVSMAIGKGGTNIKLASQLTGYTLDIFRDIEEEEETEDIYLDEFNDEIEQWVIDTLKSIGCDTAKSVLKISREDLVRRTDLEEETIDELLAVLKAEFAEDSEEEEKEAK